MVISLPTCFLRISPSLRFQRPIVLRRPSKSSCDPPYNGNPACKEIDSGTSVTKQNGSLRRQNNCASSEKLRIPGLCYDGLACSKTSFRVSWDGCRYPGAGPSSAVRTILREWPLLGTISSIACRLLNLRYLIVGACSQATGCRLIGTVSEVLFTALGNPKSSAR